MGILLSVLERKLSKAQILHIPIYLWIKIGAE